MDGLTVVSIPPKQCSKILTRDEFGDLSSSIFLPSIPSLTGDSSKSLGSVAVAEDEALETDLVKSWSRSIKNLCLPSRVFGISCAAIGILRNELIRSEHFKKACDKSMLLEPILIYVRCSLCTKFSASHIVRLVPRPLWVVMLGCSKT